MTESSSNRRLFRFSLWAVSIVFIVCAIAYWGSLIRSEVQRLSAGFAAIQPGMSEQEVTEIMGGKAPQRLKRDRLDRELLESERRKTAYILLFTNAYHLDPLVFCCFDTAGNLVAKRRFD